MYNFFTYDNTFVLLKCISEDEVTIKFPYSYLYELGLILFEYGGGGGGGGGAGAVVVLNIKMSSYQHRDPHVKDDKNPLHLHVVDRYQRRMGDNTIPLETPPSLESFDPPWVANIDLP